MKNTDWFYRESQKTLERLLPRVQPLFKNPADFDRFTTRLNQHFARLFRELYSVYGGQYDFFYHLEQILTTGAQMFIERSASLHALDDQREADPLWFKGENMIGGVCYVDLFAGDLNGIREKIPYFKELGLTYLHLMPLFECPEDSDGGYAVSDFRKVNPALGTMEQLAELAAELRENGISLVLDFVFNHTADEHIWAKNALNGDPHYQDYYFLFPDRTLPDQYEKNLREIFPEQAPGSFTYLPQLDRWVWTTFNTFQWDLNYSNPAVFNAMLGEMLFLANQGVEVLRLDAVAFIWKQMGTPCENLPEVHHIIRAFNAMVQIVAPAMLFKSEAIVHPDDVAKYISWEESPLSYNPTYMASIWEALATRNVNLLRHSMSKRFSLPEKSTWVNYIRVHDDIGWSFANEDAAEMGIQGFDHRLFLNQFYTGGFTGSFARGLPFNYNPLTLDMRICGTAASLAGLEQGIQEANPVYIENALRRLLMIHNLIIAAGGIPLLYLGDEIATINDYSYENGVNKNDSRWVHRPRFDWERAERRFDVSTPEGRIYQGIRQMIDCRVQNAAMADESTLFFDTGNYHVLGFIRNRSIMILSNFSDYPEPLYTDQLHVYWNKPGQVVDLLTGCEVPMEGMFTLEPYEYMWLSRKL